MVDRTLRDRDARRGLSVFPSIAFDARWHSSMVQKADSLIVRMATETADGCWMTSTVRRVICGSGELFQPLLKIIPEQNVCPSQL